ncbi:MAG TPA: helix-turn-helix domain-containing protein [Verrucomicrobiae bacterium]|jgi:AcrR family transcriptional regulator|nr:helix-turn-helix domain-containing protein [Verrucomicrobiae bacterium]
MVSSSVSPLSSRDRIRESAKALFARQGYESTATAAICRQAGTSESQLLKHYQSKQGLLEAIFEDAWRQINPAIRLAMDSIPNPRERFKVLIDMVLNFLGRDQDLLVLFLLEGRRIRDNGEFVVLVPGFLEFVAIVDGVLKQLGDEGELSPGIHPETIRSGLMGALEGLMRDQILGRFSKYPASYSNAHIRTICFRFLDSVLVNR